jgi:hypothetical protein
MPRSHVAVRATAACLSATDASFSLPMASLYVCPIHATSE